MYLTDDEPSRISLLADNGEPSTSFTVAAQPQSVFFRPASGTQLSFVGTDQNGDRGIWLVNREGTGLTRLDLDPGYRDDPGYADATGFYFFTMAWSPTGDRLLYTQLEPDPDSSAGPGFRNHVATIDANGTVTSDVILELNPETDDEFAGAWLPSGDGIVFQNVEGNRHWLSSAPLDGSAAGNVRDYDVPAFGWIDVVMSPDGTSVAVGLPSVGAAPRVFEVLGLADGSVRGIDAGDDFVWQRLAP